MKKQKGITLVALVVTIIVLLILASVSLSLVAGSDGILGKASSAVNKNEIATIKEKIEMKVAEEIEQFYEAKYNDRTVDYSSTALQYLTGEDITNNSALSDTQKADAKLKRKQTEEGNATYTIEYSAGTDEADILIVFEKGTTTIYNKNKEKNAQNEIYYYPTIVPKNNTNNPDGPNFEIDEDTTEIVRELSGKITKNGSITWYPYEGAKLAQ